jgi:hypothetical protein
VVEEGGGWLLAKLVMRLLALAALWVRIQWLNSKSLTGGMKSTPA